MNALRGMESWTRYGAVWSPSDPGSPPTPPSDSPPSDPPSLIGAPSGDPPNNLEPPKDGEPPKTEPVKVEPLTADSIKIPEGMVVDEPLRDKFLEVMNNAELAPQARAQALIDLQAEVAKAVSERGNKLWQDMQETWVKDAQTQFGAALEPALGNISKLLDQYGGTPEQVKELRDVFTLTGAGNHPAMVRFLDNLGKPLREGSAKSGAPSGSQRSAAERLYPNMPKGEV